MNLLLDTHLILWAAFTPDRLSGDARELIVNPANALWFSAASIWEVAIKRGLDRPDFQVEPAPLRVGLLSNGYQELPILGRHCADVAMLPNLHRDPFDRMLIAQAQSEGIELITSDTQVARYSGPIRRV